ncbi:MAG: CopL family metal-binding regulatory protein [Stenotrophomonas sp.]|uniref:CopL family metal-binding regulatory protein n=1 Tax=Stenotrophomonas sp. TaxID=69392 RepID=UPI003D6D767F
MPYRLWLPLLLICVLAAEGVLGAWVGARMAMETVASVAVTTDAGAVDPDCEPAKPVLTNAHGDHGRGKMPPHHDDCTCVDSASCECVCVLALYPPTSVKLFAGAHPLVSPDTALPVLELPASKLSRVFRPPIV